MQIKVIFIKMISQLDSRDSEMAPSSSVVWTVSERTLILAVTLAMALSPSAWCCNGQKPVSPYFCYAYALFWLNIVTFFFFFKNLNLQMNYYLRNRNYIYLIIFIINGLKN